MTQVEDDIYRQLVATLNELERQVDDNVRKGEAIIARHTARLEHQQQEAGRVPLLVRWIRLAP